MFVKKSLLFLSFFAIGLSSLHALAALDEGTVATINGKKLTKDEFDRRYKESLQSFKFTPPTKASVLNDIINFELGAQEARNERLDLDPAIRERINSVLYQALVEKRLSDKFKAAAAVTDSEARSYCRKNPEIRTSHVYVVLRPTHTQDEEKRAYAQINEALHKLQSGENFDKVVAKYSSSESYVKDKGGDIGYQTKDKLDPTYYEEARKLKVGDYTHKIVKSQFGLHIIKLTGIKDCSKVNIPEFQRMVYDEKRMKIFDDFFSGLRRKAQISVNEKLIQE